jgi:hypothetical protein
VTLHDGERRFTQVQAVMPSPIRFGSYLFDRTAGSDFVENRSDRAATRSPTLRLGPMRLPVAAEDARGRAHANGVRD